jgi:hypothetical protein
MALSKYSKFQYGWEILPTAKYIDFNDGTVKAVILSLDKYSPTKLANELASKLNAASTLDFDVVYNSATRKFTISASGNFSLLFGAGDNLEFSAHEVFGFNTTDVSGASTYTSNNASGFQYSPQLQIQSYMPTAHNRKAIDGVINKSTSGEVEVIKYGNDRFMSGEFLFITNINQASGSIIRTNKTGVEDYISFIEWCTDKGPVLFFEDENTQVFESLLLESTDKDPDGLDYELTELYDRGLSEYYKSGKLTFRLVD